VKQVGYKSLVYGLYGIIEVVSSIMKAFNILNRIFQTLAWVKPEKEILKTYRLAMLSIRKRKNA
jgi:hypothetical protein